MTEQLMHVEINCGTNEQVARPLTAEEIAQREADRIAFEAAEAERIAAEEARAALKASAKQKLIKGEPLTPEEADTIVL